MKIKSFYILSITVLSLSLFSCEKNDFPETENPAITGGFNYATTKTVTLNVNVNDTYNSRYYYKVEVYDNNPLLTDTVSNLLAAGVARADGQYVTSVVVPAHVNALYVIQTDPLKRKTTKIIKLSGSETALSCDFGLTASGAQAAAAQAQKIVMPTPHATDYALPASYTTLGSGAVTLSGSKYYVPAGVSTSQINFGWMENSELYVAGDVKFNQSLYMAPGSKIVVLNGGKVTFDIAYSFEQTGNVLAVYPGATLTLNQTSAVGQGTTLVNDGTLNMNAAFEIRANATVVNNATLTATQLTMTNSASFTNNSVFNLSSFLMNSNTAFKNNGVTTVSATVRTNNITSIINNYGVLRTPYFDMKTGGGTLNNYCKVECNDFGVDVGAINNYSGSLLSTKNLYANMSTFTLTGAAILKTGVAYNQNTTVLTEGVTYNYGVVVNGVLSGSSKPVVIVSKLNNKDGWQVLSLRGDQEYVLPASETAGANFYMAIDGGVSFVQSPTVKIEGTDCNNGGLNTGGDTGNPEDVHFPLEVKEDNQYTFAMEDLWPNLGDYDMNDFVFRMTNITKTINSQNKVLSMSFTIKPLAAGSTLRLQSALQFDKIQKSNISFVSDYGLSKTDNELSLANIVLFPDVHALFGKPTPSIVNTYPQVAKVATQSYTFTIAFNTPVDASDVVVSALNFYMVVGDASAAGRKEIHLAGYNATTKVSAATNGYIDSNNMIWALMLPTGDFSYPIESTKIYNAYPAFQQWAASGGKTNTNWYLAGKANSGLVYRK